MAVKKTFDIEDFGLSIGELQRGERNKISDVEGVSVGHRTLASGNVNTGITVIQPGECNIFKQKLTAAAHVFNGFGKTSGLVQIDELGQLESPVVLTNTLCVGRVHDAVVEYMIKRCEREGMALKSFNPVIGECNDSFLNQITKRTLTFDDVFAAFNATGSDFPEGDVGAGKGTSCHQLKGGIGSSSRLFSIRNRKYVLGVLVQSNHGLLKDLVINGRRIGREIGEKLKVEQAEEKGSIIIVLAADLPVSSRQLKRICKRTQTGLARLGSFMGHGSGEIVIGFSTAQTDHKKCENLSKVSKIIRDDELDISFRAAAEATEEAVLKSMLNASTVTGYKGNRRYSLREFFEG